MCARTVVICPTGSDIPSTPKGSRPNRSDKLHVLDGEPVERTGVPVDDASRLLKNWVHSHEDDSGGIEHYRPAGYPFPPSRGRRAFDLRADGTVVYKRLGAVDRPETEYGRWTLDGDTIWLNSDTASGKAEALDIVSLEDDGLSVRRRSGDS